MSACKIRSYNYVRAEIFGKKPTRVNRIISKRSSPQVHAEHEFSARYSSVSFSATRQDNCKCARFKLICYSHERERWDTVIVPMTDIEEDMAWLRACVMADLPIDWLNNFYMRLPESYLRPNRNYYGDNAVPYDLVGQLCHAFKVKLWEPSKIKTWCSKAVAKVAGEGRKDFIEFLEGFDLTDELRPDQLDMMARYFFDGEPKELA